MPPTLLSPRSCLMRIHCSSTFGGAVLTALPHRAKHTQALDGGSAFPARLTCQALIVAATTAERGTTTTTTTATSNGAIRFEQKSREVYAIKLMRMYDARSLRLTIVKLNWNVQHKPHRLWKLCVFRQLVRSFIHSLARSFVRACEQDRECARALRCCTLTTRERSFALCTTR